MITNIIAGATAIGTNPPAGVLMATQPNADQPNAWPVVQTAIVKITAGMPLVSYIPVPQGAFLLDGYYDPFVTASAAFTIQIGNETGQPDVFGSVAVPATPGTRISFVPGNIASLYSGLAGNSVKLTLTATPALLSEERQEKPRHHKKAKEPEGEMANGEAEEAAAPVPLAASPGTTMGYLVFRFVMQ